MKDVPAALQTHYAQAYHRIATCWKITLASGTVKRFTDHDRDLAVPSDGTYLASSGYTASSVETPDALNVANLKVGGMLVSPSITEDDLRAGIWDYAAFEIFEVDWSTLASGRNILRTGRLGRISAERGRFESDLFGLTKAYERNVGELTSPQCRATLGDARCGVNLAPLTVTGTLTGVHPDNLTVYDTSRAEAGPAGGYPIYDITVEGERAKVIVDQAVQDFIDGLPVALSEIDGPSLLNGVWTMHNTVKQSRASFFIDVDISDTGIYPDYVGSGIVTPLGADSGYFDFGVITFTSGLNNGLSMEVKQYSPGVLTLMLPLPYAAAIGDTYSLVPGCDKELLTCKNKFSNVVNFRGEPYLPGRDKIIQVGRRG